MDWDFSQGDGRTRGLGNLGERLSVFYECSAVSEGILTDLWIVFLASSPFAYGRVAALQSHKIHPGVYYIGHSSGKNMDFRVRQTWISMMVLLQSEKWV